MVTSRSATGGERRSELDDEGADMTVAQDEHAELREAMIAELRSMGGICSESVVQAFRGVPRHLFAPGTSAADAYAPNKALWAKHDEHGRMTSTVSAAHLQAVMLEQADIQPGMRVLEIGSGGYNAALIAELVGPQGRVTTVDIDGEIVDRARVCLDVAGYGRVRTVLGDGDGGVPDGAPYDRIVVTVRAGDVPPAWVDQLAVAGRMVVPLQLRGLTRSVVLDRADRTSGRLRGGNVRLCSFVPMQGAGAQDETVVAIEQPGRARVRLRTEAASGPELAALAAAIGRASGEPVTVWTGVEFDHVDDLDLWLGLHLPRFGILHADRELPGVDGSTSVTRAGAPALLDESGFAYRTKRPIVGTDRFETGVLAWGPDAAALAQQYADTVAAWGRYRAAGGTGPDVEITPSTSDVTPGPGEVVVDKHHVRIVVSWPTPS